jgi:hypothetical protein
MSGSADTLTVAAIAKGTRCQLRVMLTAWRGAHKVELAEFTPGPIPDTFWRSKFGVAIEVERLPELIAALQAAKAEARKRGLLSKQGRAAA